MSQGKRFTHTVDSQKTDSACFFHQHYVYEKTRRVGLMTQLTALTDLKEFAQLQKFFYAR